MAQCNLQRLLCMPNQQFCLHCYCPHQTLRMYISDIMPPLQDHIWIFYVLKVNSICSILECIAKSWVYSNNDLASVVTCPLIYAYQSHPRGSIDGLMSQGEFCPVTHQKQLNTGQAAWILHCSHMSPVLHSALYTILSDWVFSALAHNPSSSPLHYSPSLRFIRKVVCGELRGKASSSIKPCNM